MEISNFLSFEDLDYIKNINLYLDNLMNDIYTKDKKSYLFYAIKLKEINEIYDEYLDIVQRLLDNINRYLNKKIIEPICLEALSIILSSSSLFTNEPLFLVPSLMCLVRSIVIVKNKDNFEYYTESILKIKERLKNYDEVIRNIMKSYVNYDEHKGYIGFNEKMTEKELYKIANSFLSILMFDQNQINLSFVKKEVIDKICEILQKELNTEEKDLNILLCMANNKVLNVSNDKNKVLLKTM